MATATNIKLVRESGTDRGLLASWSWGQSNTLRFDYRWHYKKEDGVDRIEEGSNSSDPLIHNCAWTIPEGAVVVWFRVKPVAKTHTVNGQEVEYWTADWSTAVYWYDTGDLPSVPPAPTVTVEDYTLTATLDNLDLNASYIQFQIFKDNNPGPTTIESAITTRHASCSCAVSPGSEYKVRCRSVQIYNNTRRFSDWSDYSSSVHTIPSAPSGITTCRASSKTSVYLEWTAVSSADTYDIEYATKKEYLNGSDATSIVSGIETTHYEKTGLETGSEYFFRVRAVNDKGESAWSEIASTVIGKEPSAPTTWSSTTTVIVGEPLILYWVHNSEDGSSQVYAELELTIGDSVQTYTIQNTTDEDEKDKTSSYTIDTSAYPEGTTIKWRVRTSGVTNVYGDWSVQRTIEVYAPPTLVIGVTDSNATLLETVGSFPFYISGSAGPTSQKPIGYYLEITSNESYETLDYIGNLKVVKAGESVYSKNFDTSEQLLVEFSAYNIDLENNVSYTVTCTVTMNSGLTAEATATFTVGWTDVSYIINAEIGINTDTYEAYIRPYCIDESEALVEGILLSVYRREFDGTFIKLAENLKNINSSYITDPHPALDYARYRIVAISESTGAVSYYDPPGYPVRGDSVIIQWDEMWSNFDVTDDGLAIDTPWSGSMLKLKGNIDVSDKNSPDVSVIEYIGRKHPVSYYGTQLGETSTWKTDVPKNDKETVYALRRLKSWMGDAYVREPSGTGYWANVVVSFSQTHREVVIPVTLEITRVEGGEP